jgi:hypothetical protein
MRYRLVIGMSVMCSIAWGQAKNTVSSPTESGSQPGQKSMPGMSMSGDTDKHDESESGLHVMHSMEGHMDMGPHMKMTSLRAAKAGDAARAQRVAEEARSASEKYVDYHAALADGFKIFHPEVPQKVYHFTNYGYAMEAAFHFNPDHPTSLLYEKQDEGYKLVGVMYTAPKRFDEDQLDERIPLSVAQWHEHVNYCAPPADRKQETLAKNPQFGLRGSITTQQACDAAGGVFHPVIFNWMVHLYPFEKNPAKVWSVERQQGAADGQ